MQRPPVRRLPEHQMRIHTRSFRFVVLVFALVAPVLTGAQTTSSSPAFLGDSLVGKDSFDAYCASCHGSDARGAGPRADQLRRLPPSLTSFAARNGGVFPSERVRRIIDGRDIPAHGTTEMPVWGDAFRRSREGLSHAAAAARIDAIVRYLESIQERATF
jgi:mono/diheme cytochrome c family protein